MVQVEQVYGEKKKMQADVEEFQGGISDLKSNVDILLEENKALKKKNQDLKS